MININYKRRPTCEVKAGGVTIGGSNPVRLQSMLNVSTMDTGACVEQTLRIVDAGGEIVRLTAQGTREAKNLQEIHDRLRASGCNVPLVADVHFNPKVADEAALHVEKVRINPGNYANSVEDMEEKFPRLLQLCKEHGTALRIGVNHGSLNKRMVEKYGDTAEGMTESCLEYLRLCKSHDFDDVVLSVKASNVRVMAQTVRMLCRRMDEEGMDYPLHLGVTEAGEGEDGRIKSAVGIGTLLSDGIGDTIRVSLTEDPVNEISAGKIIAGYYDGIRNGSIIPHDPSKPRRYKCNSWEELIILAACEFGTALMDRKIDDFEFTGEYMEEGKAVILSEEKKEYLKDEIMQAARRRFTKPEYVACPGCGRTMYNLEKTFNEVKKRTAHLKGMTIAVMGCIVNGPGEMADAHYGYIGEGKGKVSIYKGKQAVAKGVPEDKAIDMLVEIIEKDNKSSNQ